MDKKTKTLRLIEGGADHRSSGQLSKLLRPELELVWCGSEAPVVDTDPWREAKSGVQPTDTSDQEDL